MRLIRRVAWDLCGAALTFGLFIGATFGLILFLWTVAHAVDRMLGHWFGT